MNAVTIYLYGYPIDDINSQGCDKSPCMHVLLLTLSRVELNLDFEFAWPSLQGRLLTSRQKINMGPLISLAPFMKSYFLVHATAWPFRFHLRSHHPPPLLQTANLGIETMTASCKGFSSLSLSSYWQPSALMHTLWWCQASYLILDLMHTLLAHSALLRILHWACSSAFLTFHSYAAAWLHVNIVPGANRFKILSAW